ncbi:MULTISPECIES: HNH endonuclease signature motif containing protein [unclassified Pseudarthrobacter]|uniref:HNH endonuclease signature motif containing protein n=1 Tax=unclassified Pseudarthrobacter TaxID=2647000 RepID=UPI0030774F36
MGIPGVEEAVEAFEAAAAEFAAYVRRGLGGRGSGMGSQMDSGMGSGGGDPLRGQADACLDGLGGSVRVDAMVAAFRVRLAAAYAGKAAALDGPVRSPGEHTAQEMGVVSEVACALTVSERSASALLAQAHELTTALPLTLAALQAGDVSWQHARVMVDETTGLDAAGAAALEARFLGPDVSDRARECPAGELVPSRFRHKARAWRERHHPVSIEKRHARSVLDRRLEYVPDRDGMAWLSAYLPADRAAGIWNGITAAARTLQGPAETRTMTQLRADIAAQLLLSAGFTGTTASPAEGSTDTAAGSPSTNDVGAGKSGYTTTAGSTPDRRTAAGSRAPDRDVSAGCPAGPDLTAGSSPDSHGDAGSVLATGTAAGNESVAGRVETTGTAAGNEAVAGSDVLPGNDLMTGRVPSPAAQVLVTVPVFALMGLTDEPATLDGYGPIPASMARNLVADGADSFHRVLTDPRNGAPLEIGRQSYRIPAAMRQWLRLRDGKCPFPGCSNQSLDNEADHLLAWADGGTTGISNLGQPCPKHHRLKHTTAWTPTEASIDKPPGWTSPTGRHYQSEHQDWEPPWLPAQILAQFPDQEHSPAVHNYEPDDQKRASTAPEGILPDDFPEDPLPEWALFQEPKGPLAAGGFRRARPGD